VLFRLYASRDGSEFHFTDGEQLLDRVRMSVGEWLTFIRHIGLLEMKLVTVQTALQAFLWSRIRALTEYTDCDETELRHLNFEDFMECLVRLATILAVPTGGELDEAHCTSTAVFLHAFSRDASISYLEYIERRTLSFFDKPRQRTEDLVSHLIEIMVYNLDAGLAGAERADKASLSSALPPRRIMRPASASKAPSGVEDTALSTVRTPSIKSRVSDDKATAGGPASGSAATAATAATAAMAATAAQASSGCVVVAPERQSSGASSVGASSIGASSIGASSSGLSTAGTPSAEGGASNARRRLESGTSGRWCDGAWRISDAEADRFCRYRQEGGELLHCDLEVHGNELVAAMERAEANIMHSLRDVPAFDMLGAEELATLRAALSVAKFEDGERVINQGEEGDTFYLITTGSCDVLRFDPRFCVGEQGGEEIVGRLHSSDCFGERALLHKDVRAASIRAGPGCRLYVVFITRENFELALGKPLEAFQKLRSGDTAGHHPADGRT